MLPIIPKHLHHFSSFISTEILQTYATVFFYSDTHSPSPYTQRWFVLNTNEVRKTVCAQNETRPIQAHSL